MTYPNTLIFVDFPSPDPEATAEFYAAVFGWEVEGRPAGVFHRIVPGQNFQLDDGSQSEIGNLHMGIHNAANARPHPEDPAPGPQQVATDGRGTRCFILVSEDDSIDRIMDEAIKRGADELWRDHYWAEFNGFNSSFRDPWGNQFVLWVKGGDDPQIPEGWTNE